MTARSEELQTLTTSSLGDLIRKQLADEIEKTARLVRVGRQIVTVNRQLIPKGKGNTIEFFKRGSLTALDVSEGGDMSQTTAEPTYTKILTVTAKKIGLGSKITHEAITDVREDVINACKEELAEAIADKEDYDIFQTAYGATAQTDDFTGDGSTKTFTATLKPVCELTSVKVATVAVTGSTYVARTGVVTLLVAPATDAAVEIITNYVATQNRNTDVAGTVDLEDILQSRLKIVNSEKKPPDILVISEKLVHGLLALDQFIDSSKYGAREALLNAEIGKLAGMRLLVASQVQEDMPIEIRKEKAITLAEKEGIRVETDDKPATDSLEIYTTERYGLGLLRSGAVSIVVA